MLFALSQRPPSLVIWPLSLRKMTTPNCGLRMCRRGSSSRAYVLPSRPQHYRRIWLYPQGSTGIFPAVPAEAGVSSYHHLLYSRFIQINPCVENRRPLTTSLISLTVVPMAFAACVCDGKLAIYPLIFDMHTTFIRLLMLAALALSNRPIFLPCSIFSFPVHHSRLSNLLFVLSPSI